MALQDHHKGAEARKVPIISLNHDGRVRDCNSATERVLEYSAEELQGMNMKDLMHPDDLKGETEGLGRLISRSGRLIYANIRVTSICDEEIVIIEDQTEIMESLREKELLLREIHHRVKNNLQIISSLLSLQAHNMHDRTCRALLGESQNRIRSMALIHEQLYRSGDFSAIDFSSYASELIRNLRKSYSTDKNIEFSLEIDKINLNLETAIPLGLILSELITNSLKHAFKGMDGGLITVRFTREDLYYVLEVVDNGTGFREEGLRNSDSLGFKLVEILTDQLDGTLKVSGEGGGYFRIKFRGPVYRNRMDMEP